MKKIILYLPPLLIILLLFSLCNDENIIDPQPVKALVLGDTVSIAYGETARNFMEHIWLSFDTLLEDSRCPLGAECLWEGNARLQFSFGYLTDKSTISLNTFRDFRNDTTLNNYNISLVDVQPVPIFDSTITIYDYRALVVVNKE